jgi:hypothetical protein
MRKWWRLWGLLKQLRSSSTAITCAIRQQVRKQQQLLLVAACIVAGQ